MPGEPLGRLPADDYDRVMTMASSWRKVLAEPLSFPGLSTHLNAWLGVKPPAPATPVTALRLVGAQKGFEPQRKGGAGGAMNPGSSGGKARAKLAEKLYLKSVLGQRSAKKAPPRGDASQFGGYFEDHCVSLPQQHPF